MSASERSAYWKERDQQRVRDIAVSKIRGSEQSIANLNAALALAEVEAVDDTNFQFIIKQEIERHKMDIYKAKREMILALSGARINDHEI